MTPSREPHTTTRANRILGAAVIASAAICVYSIRQADPDLSRANLVLIPQRYPLAAALSADPRFRVVYRDHVAVAFVRANRAEGN